MASVWDFDADRYQTFTTTLATPGENRPSTLGFHARAKAKLALSGTF
jgi:hypothetical protein